MITKQASAMSMSELTLSLLQRDQPEIWHYLDQMPHSTPRAGLLFQVAKKSTRPVADLWNREPHKVLNGAKIFFLTFGSDC